jgi:hypothetical protein
MSFYSNHVLPDELPWFVHPDDERDAEYEAWSRWVDGTVPLPTPDEAEAEEAAAVERQLRAMNEPAPW